MAGLSSYERERELNIRQNQAMFAELFSDVQFSTPPPPSVAPTVASPTASRKRGRPRLTDLERERSKTLCEKRPSVEPVRSSQRSKTARLSAAELYAEINEVAARLMDPDEGPVPRDNATDESGDEENGERTHAGLQTQSGKARSKDGVQEKMLSLLSEKLKESAKKAGEGGKGGAGGDEVIQMVRIPPSQREPSKQERNPELSKVRHENHEKGMRYGKLLTAEERTGLAGVIDKPPYYMETKLALVLDRIMDLYDDHADFQDGQITLTGHRAASTLRISKLIAVKCVAYLTEKKMINYRVPGVSTERPKRPEREERRVPTNDDLPPGIFLLADRNQYVKNKSGYLGVRRRTDGKYESRFYGKGLKRGNFLGLFNTAREAAAAWDREAIRVRGADTFTNLGRESALSMLAEGALQQSTREGPASTAVAANTRARSHIASSMPVLAPSQLPIAPYLPPAAVGMVGSYNILSHVPNAQFQALHGAAWP